MLRRTELTWRSSVCWYTVPLCFFFLSSLLFCFFSFFFSLHSPASCVFSVPLFIFPSHSHYLLSHSYFFSLSFFPLPPRFFSPSFSSLFTVVLSSPPPVSVPPVFLSQQSASSPSTSKRRSITANGNAQEDMIKFNDNSNNNGNNSPAPSPHKVVPADKQRILAVSSASLGTDQGTVGTGVGDTHTYEAQIAELTAKLEGVCNPYSLFSSTSLSLFSLLSFFLLLFLSVSLISSLSLSSLISRPLYLFLSLSFSFFPIVSFHCY